MNIRKYKDFTESYCKFRLIRLYKSQSDCTKENKEQEMKKEFLTGILIGLSTIAQAAETNNMRLYQFSDPLLDAVKNCRPYNEEFTKINPDLASIGVICQRVEIHINGLNPKNLCQATIVHKTQDQGRTTYKCSLNRQQREELYQAMLNRSLDPVTQTFITYEPYEDSSGKIYKEAIEKTMTDTVLNIAVAKLKANACTSEYEEANEAQQQRFSKYVLTFSKNFQKKLQNCEKGEEYIKTAYLSKPIKIIGKDANACVVDSTTFVYHIPMSEIYKLTNYDQLTIFATDPQIAVYTPSPDIRHTYSALESCQREEEDYQSPTYIQRINNIKMTKLTTSHNQDHDCVIKYREIVERPEYHEEFETVCVFSEDIVNDLIKQYPEPKNKKQEKQIGQKIYNTLQNKGYCHLNEF